MFKYGDIQNILLLFDRKLNILSYHIQELQTRLKWPSFWPNL